MPSARIGVEREGVAAPNATAERHEMAALGCECCLDGFGGHGVDVGSGAAGTEDEGSQEGQGRLHRGIVASGGEGSQGGNEEARRKRGRRKAICEGKQSHTAPMGRAP